ncbi:TPA: hypothetical protein L4605_004346 [Pseudomonas aeruginosa]|uniref:hypothetical protein n=1 Tax=Pseudomonas aeruginosa TaxID=287 RepID=UPI001CC00D68|nr:hypothetical protein [Pseudomonas aeruginosa]HBO2993426.1 hypothetical protein [Pseudomonas aeruginosa]HBO5656578.1 hypothetical protein [Pseudomonas aeruginosa]HCI1863541.1 hypothetical protein [Pseudomonas aeruginosa]HCI2647567.1 hypothetical protein [Pseudomonas aeruginosa]
MNLFKKLFGWLISPRRPIDPEHPDLHVLDLDDLIRELRVEENARRLGLAGAPSAEATSLSGPEEAICQKLEGYRRSYQNWATSRAQRIQDSLITYDITKTVNRAANLADEFEREANRRISDRETELRNLRDIARKREEELAKFREKNKLTRHAQDITGTRKAICILMAIATVVLEGVLNAGFFAAGLDGGLFQGFFYAGSLAAMNVGVAFIIGRFFLPNMNHVNPLRKAAGYLSLVAAFVIMGGLGLMIAHFRDALGQGGDAEGGVIAAAALQALLNSPFGFHDLFSVLLCGLSVVFALGGLFEGYKLTDPYPGYAKAQQVADEAKAFYEDEISLTREELELMKEDYLTKLDDGVEKAKIDVVDFRSQVDAKRTLPERLQRSLDKVENMMRALVKTFRTENEIYRRDSGVPAPAYFHEPVPVQPLKLPDFSTAADEQALGEQERLLTDLLGRVEDIRKRIQSSYDVKFSQLEPIRQQI